MHPSSVKRVEQAFRPAYRAIVFWASGPEVLERLKPHGNTALNATLKRCSTQTHPPENKIRPTSIRRDALDPALPSGFVLNRP